LSSEEIVIAIAEILGKATEVQSIRVGKRLPRRFISWLFMDSVVEVLCYDGRFFVSWSLASTDSSGL